MPFVTIGEIAATATTPLSGDEWVEIEQGGVTKKCQASVFGGSGTSSRPWSWNPPLASSFSVKSGDATLPSLADDSDVGLMFYGGAYSGTPTNLLRMAYRVLSNKLLDWELKVHFTGVVANLNYGGLGINLYDSVSRKCVLFHMKLNFNTAPTVATEYYGDMKDYSSAPLVGGFGGIFPTWFRVKSVGSDLLLYVSCNGKQWTLLKTLSNTAWMTSRADNVGIGVSYNQIFVPLDFSVDYFSLTGPAV